LARFEQSPVARSFHLAQRDGRLRWSGAGRNLRGSGIFAALAEFESELIRERTMAGLQAARARGRKGGRKFALTKAQVRVAQAAMANRDTSVAELCKDLGIRPVTLYRYVDPKGN
jgi:DNA invertase Pin-like site-specific DNA recombinase